MKRSPLRIVYDLLEPGDAIKTYGVVVDRALIGLIILNVAAVIAESFEGPATEYAQLFRVFESASVVVFTAEYLTRIVTSPYRFPDRGRGAAILAYVLTPMALIDLAAILPFYLPFVLSVDLRFLRVLRLVRILRVLKVNRYSSALSMIAKVLRRKVSELVVTMFVTSLLLLLASAVMYYIEHETQPEAFPNIIASFWWAVATLTTVGYGDVFPVTAWGRLVAGVIAFLGIGLVALPTGIVSAGFLEEFQQRGRAGIRERRLRRAKARVKSARKTRGTVKRRRRQSIRR